MRNKVNIVIVTLFIFNIPIFADMQRENFIDLNNRKKENISSDTFTTTKKKVEINTRLQKRQDKNFIKNDQKNNRKDVSNHTLKKTKSLKKSKDRQFIPIDIVVLDAGHGGKHIGCVTNGFSEKQLCLILVKKIHMLFRKTNPSVQVYVTRKNDQFVSLKTRISKTAKWSENNNILFISIHANSAHNSKAEGFEIYTVSDKASDSSALATERIENAGFSAEDIQKTDVVYSVLADLIKDSTRKQSEWLAQYVYDYTLSVTKAYGRGLKRANFFVLKYNIAPSILIEVGYLSNAKESKLLKNTAYQNKIAIGIFKGISNYINDFNKTEGFVK